MGKPPHSKYIRIDRRKEKQNNVTSIKNQPTPKIWTPLIFKPKPKDRISYYSVNPGKPINLDAVAAKLAELYGMNVWVYESLFGCFEVYLENKTEVQVIEECTLKALEVD